MTHSYVVQDLDAHIAMTLQVHNELNSLTQVESFFEQSLFLNWIVSHR